MKKIILFIILLAAGLLLANSTWAEETKLRCLEGVEFLTGFEEGKLSDKKDYRLIPFVVAFDLSLKPLTQKINFNPRQLLQFQIEPFISFVSSPDTNAEIGTAFLLKIGILPQSAKFQPYVKVGSGIVYMTQHTREQSTQFNFIEQAGVGAHYFFSKNTAFTLEGYYRHLSNASMKRPNRGIETYYILTGISYRF